MANSTLNEMWCDGKGLTTVAGSFAPDTASAPTTARGSGWSAAYTSTGLFTVTFDDPYYELVSATATLQLASADDKFLQIGTYTASAKTLTIRVRDISGGGVANISANANNRVNFNCVFRNSSVTP